MYHFQNCMHTITVGVPPPAGPAAAAVAAPPTYHHLLPQPTPPLPTHPLPGVPYPLHSPLPPAAAAYPHSVAHHGVVPKYEVDGYRTSPAPAAGYGDTAGYYTRAVPPAIPQHKQEEEELRHFARSWLAKRCIYCRYCKRGDAPDTGIGFF
jgi:hypothetical protein